MSKDQAIAVWIVLLLFAPVYLYAIARIVSSAYFKAKTYYQVDLLAQLRKGDVHD